MNQRWWIDALRGAVLVHMLGMALGVLGQCANDNVQTGAAVTPPCPGSTSVPCVQGGQYALVNVVAGNIYTFATCGSTFDTQITLYNNTGGAWLGYNDDGCGLQSTVTWTATFTGQLRVLVDQYFCANGTTCATLTISCAAPPPPVTNDNPCSSIPLTVNSSCIMQSFTNVGATTTAGVPSPICGGIIPTSADVWFTFVAPPTGIVSIQTAAGTMTDGAMAVYSAPSCSGPFSLVECDDDDGPGLMPQLDFTGLNPGQTYFIRYWGYGASTGTFQICVSGITSVPAGDCVYVLNMFDSFGDGWDGSTVGISLNGGPYTNYTITGSSGIALIGVNIGDILVVNYTSSGIFQGEISYSLSILGGGCGFNSGSPPATGIVLTQTVDCNPPPAAPEDCEGGFTICSGQAFSNNSTGTGCVVDLNSGNYGCLSSAERQGTWYYFSPSTGGNIAFTISPSNPLDDYDFAIWGPMTAPSCPPAGPPVRCSYAAPPGDTGLNYTATDNTETAAGDKWVNDLTVVGGEVFILYISNFSQSGLSFDLTWNLTNGASLDCTVLPVELLSFEGTAMDDHVSLDWLTASETNTDRFEVQRADDGQLYLSLVTVDAAGSSLSGTHYHTVDPSPREGINYYRLRAVDGDGGEHYSPTVSVAFGGADGALGLPVPNPATGNVSFDLSGLRAGMYSLTTTDVTGRVMDQRRVDPDGGGRRVMVPIADWPAGVYRSSLIDAAGRTVGARRFVKQ